MALPIFKDDNQTFQLMQTKWASEINPVLAIPLLNGLQLNNIKLVIGVNNINHMLARKQQGWIITDSTGISSVYRSGAFNDKTLILTSTALTTIGIWVY